MCSIPFLSRSRVAMIVVLVLVLVSCYYWCACSVIQHVNANVVVASKGHGGDGKCCCVAWRFACPACVEP